MNEERNNFPIFVLIVLFFGLALHNMAPLVIKTLVEHKVAVASAVALLIGILTWRIQILWRIRKKRVEVQSRLHRKTSADSIFLGNTPKGDPVIIPLSARRMHAQVVGTTNAGKTESVILPWAIDDIANGRGLILIDGKSDRGLLDKLYAYTVKHKRSKDFRMLSLVNGDISCSFNPLIGGSPDEVTERVFSAFNFEDEYYKNLQYEGLSKLFIYLRRQRSSPLSTR